MCVNVCMSVFSALIFIITSLLPLHYVCFFLLGKAGIENISNFRIQEFNAIHFSLSIAFAASCKFFAFSFLFDINICYYCLQIFLDPRAVHICLLLISGLIVL